MCIDGRALNRARRLPRTQAGLSLVEAIMFVIIVGIGVAGILSVFNLTTQKSADPQVRKQMLAAAEALLEEVEFKPFTICDPDDPNASLPTTVSSAFCTGGTNGANDESKLTLGQLGPEAGETRDTYDNVSDYNGLSLPTVSDISGSATLNGYSATVKVTQEQLDASIPLEESLRITVTVTHGGDSLSLSGYRLRYAPRSPP
jgi:MSHA pilin protein MshD